MTEASRGFNIDLSIKNGDKLYFRPTKWTGATLPSISLYGIKNGSYTLLQTVYALNELAIVESTNDFDNVRITYNVASVPATNVTMGAEFYVLGDDIYSKLLLSESDGDAVVVSPNGEYPTIQSGIGAVQNGGTVYVMPGTYVEQIDTQSKNVNIIGTDKNSCILQDNSGAYATPPIEISGGSIQNMTIIETASDVEEYTGTNGLAYCIHSDFSQMASNKLLISNCILKNNTRACIGIGAKNGFKLIVENCDIWSGVQLNTGYTPRGAFYAHTGDGTLTKNAKIILKNNRIRCDDAMAMCLERDSTVQIPIEYEFINNNLYSEINGVANSIITNGNNQPLSFDSTGTIKHPASYGNNVALLNA